MFKSPVACGFALRNVIKVAVTVLHVLYRKRLVVFLVGALENYVWGTWQEHAFVGNAVQSCRVLQYRMGMLKHEPSVWKSRRDRVLE